MLRQPHQLRDQQVPYVTRARRVISVKNDMHIRELLQSRHRWQQERQESNRFNNNNKKTHLPQANKKKYSILF